MKISEIRFTKAQVLEAAKHWDMNPGLRAFKEGTRYEVRIGRKSYPPKALISIANELATKGKTILKPNDFKGAINGKWHQALAAADPSFKPVPKNGQLLGKPKLRSKKPNQTMQVLNEEKLFSEGAERKAFKLHVIRERDPEVIKRAKQNAKKEGKLCCIACGFDFAKVYGELGDGYIEGHHTKPISKKPKQGEETKVEDIALVCSNCHRMLHRIRPTINVGSLKKLIKKQQSPQAKF